MKIYQQLKNENIQTRVLKERIMFSLWKKETSNQKMQISTESNTEISRNINIDNNNNRIMQIRMISDDDMSTTSFMTEHDQKSSIIEWKNRMRIICTIMK